MYKLAKKSHCQRIFENVKGFAVGERQEEGPIGLGFNQPIAFLSIEFKKNWIAAHEYRLNCTIEYKIK